MSSTSLDPWNDAATIADRLASPSARLIVMIGAEAWCETCRTLRPVFDAMAQERAERHETWLWLDLEEHGEFLGEFIPANLPWMMVYKAAQLTHASLIGGASATLLEELLAQPARIDQGDMPDIRSRLMASDWAL